MAKKKTPNKKKPSDKTAKLSFREMQVRARELHQDGKNDGEIAEQLNLNSASEAKSIRHHGRLKSKKENK